MSNKSEATWHPNTPPAAGHADLIAQARRRADVTTSIVEAALLRDLADSLVSEREATNQIVREETALLRHKYRGAMSIKGRSQRERDEARAERDALARVIEQARIVGTQLDTVKADVLNALQPYDAAPPASLARHDAEMKARALEAAATSARAMHDPVAADCEEWASWLDARAAAIRAEAE